MKDLFWMYFSFELDGAFIWILMVFWISAAKYVSFPHMIHAP
jgi:hypothetical protein